MENKVVKALDFKHDIVYNINRQKEEDMLISLAEYGQNCNKSGDTLRRMAEKGLLKTAHKIGRNWVVDSEEVYPVKKRKRSNASMPLAPHNIPPISAMAVDSKNFEEKRPMRYSETTVKKANGIVYTPCALARYVANQILDKYHKTKDIFTILDPAIGDGELVMSLIKELMKRFDNPDISVFGFETDTNVINQTKFRISREYPNVKIVIEEMDFLDLYTNPHLQKYDFIIANPPYIRTQILGADKAQEIAKLAGLDGRVDIYYAFLTFAEQLLTDEGIAGFITSNKFMTIKAGKAVRKQLLLKSDILKIIDLGDTKLFSASVLPCVIVFRKKKEDIMAEHIVIYETKDKNPNYRVVNSIFDGIDSSGAIELDDGRKFNITTGTLRADLDGSPWRINTTSRNLWLDAVERNTAKSFSDLGKIRVGIKTTADNVFIQPTWNDDEYMPELLRPLITHRNAGQISSDNMSFWKVLYTHTTVAGKKVAYDIELYPNALRYLEFHKKQLEGRTYIRKAHRNWYEIWVPQNPDAWADRKIVFRDISEKPQFWLDQTGAVVNGDCYWIDIYDHVCEDEVLLALAIANSSFIEQYYDTRFNNKLYSGKRRFMSQYVEQFPLPDFRTVEAQEVIGIVKNILTSRPSSDEKAQKLHTVSTLVESIFSH